jgi:RNA polymerase sigma-70 factor (ECF subfamily)
MEPVDLLERCRAGDRDAFRALVAAWGGRALAIARCFTDEPRRAEQAVATALINVWRELPSLHSQRAFRPWLMSHVAEAAGAAEADERALALREARAPDRAGMSAMREARAVANADDTVRAMLDEINGSKHTLPLTFFDDALARRLKDPVALDIGRIVEADRAHVWRTLRDPSALPKWVSARDLRVTGELKPGTTIKARGKIADKRASIDRTTITRADEGELLSWVTRAHPDWMIGRIEFRWSMRIEDEQVRHRLHGVAFPPGLAAVSLRRSYARVQSDMSLSMHRGLERFAALVASRR